MEHIIPIGKTTVLARLRFTIAFTEQTIGWMNQNFPKDAWFVKNEGSLFLEEFGGTWQELIEKTINQETSTYFSELGIPRDYLPYVSQGETYRGSWIMDTAIVMNGSIGESFSVLKQTAKKLPDIAEGFSGLRDKILKKVEPSLNREVSENLYSAANHSIHENPISKTDRPSFPPPPSSLITTNFTIDPRPLAELTPAILKPHKTDLSISLDLDTAYAWLNLYGESYLRPASRQLSDSMAENIAAKDFRTGWATLRELIKFIEPPCDARESIEILIICGWAAFHMNDEAEAVKILKDACFRASVDKHQHAIAGWMLGYILWLTPYPNMHEAIMAWQRSIDRFDDLARQRTLTSEKAQWYQNRWAEMVESLEKTIAAGGISAGISPVAGSRRASPSSYPYHPGGPPVASVKRHQIRSFPVIGQIPAGTPDILAEQSGTMTFEDVILDDFYYRIVSLKRGESIINLPDGKEYYVLKVSGNSMNKAQPEPIMDKDYVLLHKQDRANQGNIVAVQIVDVEDNRATLKRYSIEGGQPVFKPESNDPAFQKPIFPSPDKFHIRGVALAVLKRLEE